jgi:dynactin complex subunit
LNDPDGKNDGSVAGVRYFECPENCGLFVKRLQAKLDPDAPTQDTKEKKRTKIAGSAIPKISSAAAPNPREHTSQSEEPAAAISASEPDSRQGDPPATFNSARHQEEIRALEGRIEQLSSDHAAALVEVEAQSQQRLAEQSKAISILESQVETQKTEIIRLTSAIESSGSSSDNDLR